MVRRTAIAVAALLATGSAVLAQQDLVVQRHAVMRNHARSMYSVMNKMVRGTAPFDAKQVEAALVSIETEAAKMPGLYPESTKGLTVPDSDYNASPKLWQSKGEFDAMIVELAKTVASYKGKIKTLDALKAAYPVIDGKCNACHEKFRVKG